MAPSSSSFLVAAEPNAGRCCCIPSRAPLFFLCSFTLSSSPCYSSLFFQQPFLFIPQPVIEIETQILSHSPRRNRSQFRNGFLLSGLGPAKLGNDTLFSPALIFPVVTHFCGYRKTKILFHRGEPMIRLLENRKLASSGASANNLWTVLF